MSWGITGVLFVVVVMIMWAELRGARRDRRFHAKFDPAVDALKQDATDRYRARFGRDPTAAITTIPPGDSPKPLTPKRA